MRIVLTLVAFLLAACAVPSHLPGPVKPVLSRDRAERTAFEGDDLLRAALASGVADSLPSVFRRRAVTVLRLQVARLAERGVSIEERSVSRRLASYDAASGEGILAVSSEYRLTTRDDGNAAWAATERQWWFRIDFEDGGWWIIEQENLPPDRWVLT